MTGARVSGRRTGGFTLIEAIVVIVVLGILAGIVAVFVRAPILSYRDAVDRAEMTDQADLTLRRIARDIRLALPNSVRVLNGSTLEFLQTRSGGRYLSVEDGVPTRPALDDPAQTAFTVLAPPDSFGQVVAGDRVAVYNLGVAQADAYTGGNTGVVQAVPATATDAALGRIATVQLNANPFAAADPALPSPTRSFHVVSGPVSFYCQDAGDGTQTLMRAWGYAISATQSAVPSGGQRAIVAARLTNCNGLFNYDTAATQRTGLVLVSLELRGRTPDSPAIRLVHQIHVDNTP
ncbi:type II secretion system protein [Massilia phyllosphaerae]|uniref:type II secretion system protein n=1 Tax=Massilia phyllosphaerae TaxID=3106034 RepID=UPI002B1CBF6D|nr:type II secretion system protein [Massilia sp. SGZ-792]